MSESHLNRNPATSNELSALKEKHLHDLISYRHRKDRGPAFGLTEKQQALVEKVAMLIKSGGYATERTFCVCSTTRAKVISQIDRYGLPMDTVICSQCGTLRFDPYLSDRSLADFYTLHYQDMYGRVPEANSYFQRQRGYGKRLLTAVQASLPVKAVVLEVGCGAGGALSIFKESGHQTFGCDYSARLIDHGRSRGINSLSIGDLAEARKELGISPQSVDLIFLHHVFEHLLSPIEWLRSARELLKPTGSIVVAVPDAAEIDSYKSPNGDLRLFLHIAHKYNFTIAGLEAAATQAGLNTWPINVERSTAAPEIWVAFSVSSTLAVEPAEVWRGSSTALLRRLRSAEKRYLFRSVFSKIRSALRITSA